MFKGFFTTAFRQIWKHRLFALINVTGLGIGLGACLLILLFVRHETSYDQFLPDLDKVYRMESQANIPGRPSNDFPNSFGATYDLLPPEYPEIDRLARLRNTGGTIIRDGETFAERVSYADPEFFDIFRFKVLEGNTIGALDRPDGMVLSRDMAEKHLRPAPWVGQTLVVNQFYERTLQVMAVIENIPPNSHFDMDIIIPIEALAFPEDDDGQSELNRWNGLSWLVYIKLREDATIDHLTATINDWVDRHFPDNISALVNISGSELFTPRLLPVTDIHLYSPAFGSMRPSGSLTTLAAYSAIAVLILVIASINFMNLATAQATHRAKEVAIRKVMGASRLRLLIQFESEALLHAFMGLVLAFGLVWLALPYFTEFTDRELPISGLFNPLLILGAVLLTTTVGLGAGLHPAVITSALRPARVLMSNQSTEQGKGRLKAFLVLLQFVISAGLIIMTLLIQAQTDYATRMDLGYDRYNKMGIRGIGSPDVAGREETLRAAAAGLEGVTAASLASFAPGDFTGAGLSLRVPGIVDRVIIFYRSVSPEFLHQFDVTPLAGRLLDAGREGDRSPEILSDSMADTTYEVNVVVNLSAARRLGFTTPEEAIGKIYYRGENDRVINTIIGVVPDVLFGSPRQLYQPELYMFVPGEFNVVLLSIAPGMAETVEAAAEKLWRDMMPNQTFNLQHLDENVRNWFEEERIQGQLLAFFSGLAILVACMGLFGLAAFTVHRRTKEIGLRKVMGASSPHIVWLLVKQLSVPVAIANVLAWPFAWYAGVAWLERFEHRIDIAPEFAFMAIVAAALTLGIAWSTVAGHALRVARRNPIQALRHE